MNEQPLLFVGKMPHKPLDLLKALLVGGGRGISRRILCDALWSDLDSGLAPKALNAAVFRLRRILANKRAVCVDGEMVRLDEAYCRVDAWDFEFGVTQTTNPRLAEAALRAYRGPFLGTSDHPLAFDARNRLRRKFMRAVLRQGQLCEQRGCWDAAAEVYQHALDIDGETAAVADALIRTLSLASRQGVTKSANGTEMDYAPAPW